MTDSRQWQLVYNKDKTCMKTHEKNNCMNRYKFISSR